MAGLVPAIHAAKLLPLLRNMLRTLRLFVLRCGGGAAWMAGTSPAMTSPLLLVAVMSFALDPRLAADTLEIGDLALSRAAADERLALSLADPRAAPRGSARNRRPRAARSRDADRGNRRRVRVLARAAGSRQAQRRRARQRGGAIARPRHRPRRGRPRLARPDVGPQRPASLRARRRRSDDRPSPRRAGGKAG